MSHSDAIGSDLMTWMVNYFESVDRNLVRAICDLLLTNKIVHHVARADDVTFIDSAEEYYRFQVPSNPVCVCTCACGWP